MGSNDKEIVQFTYRRAGLHAKKRLQFAIKEEGNDP